MVCKLRTKIVLAMALVALLVAGAAAAATFYFRRAQLLNDYQVFVRGVAGTAALALSGDEIATIRSAADEQTAAFQKARELLEKVRAINHLGAREIYVLRPLTTDCGTTEFVVSLHPGTAIGDRYLINAENLPPLRHAWESGTPAHTGIYRDLHGQWISGYARVPDARGEPVAIIEVDAETSALFAKERWELCLTALISAAAFLAAMVPGLFLASNITRALSRLSTGITRLESGHYDGQVTVRSGDEIEDLAEVFNRMLGSLQEKLALLPFVSRFTAEAVRRSRSDRSWLTGAEQEVIVLFADLRGFTSFSEDRGATELVGTLNQLLALQADVVIAAGGDVDKFVGDAIMAVFLTGESSAQAAFSCARQMIDRVRERATANGWPLALGVGLHSGQAVVGAIGSDTRRDFTAIGHTVNLASRLCDHAPAWQILVSEDFLTFLPAEDRALFAPTEPITFKNIHGVVRTYACAELLPGASEVLPSAPSYS